MGTVRNLGSVHLCLDILRIENEMKQNTKDWIQYASAIALIASAITMAFTSIIVLSDVTAGVNAYIGIAVSGALAIFGVSAYMVNQMASFKTEIRSELETMKEEERHHKHHIKPEENGLED